MLVVTSSIVLHGKSRILSSYYIKRTLRKISLLLLLFNLLDVLESELGEMFYFRTLKQHLILHAFYFAFQEALGTK